MQRWLIGYLARQKSTKTTVQIHGKIGIALRYAIFPTAMPINTVLIHALQKHQR